MNALRNLEDYHRLIPVQYKIIQSIFYFKQSFAFTAVLKAHYLNLQSFFAPRENHENGFITKDDSNTRLKGSLNI